MLRKRRWGLAHLLAAVFALSFVAAEPHPVCVASWTEVRYRNFGYDHIVHLENSCEEQVECFVTTNSNPQGSHVVVPASSHIALLMFQASPHRTFTARTDCGSR